MTTSIPGLPGTFHYARSTGAWTWSDEMFMLYGFAPGDVVPTVDLILAHQHPDDRAAVEQALQQAFDSGRPFWVWHRLHDARGSTRQVVTVGAGDFDDDGSLRGLRGHLVDLTEPVRRTTALEVEVAIEHMSQSRPVIEQAKGALMALYAFDADDAFALLRRYSQLMNVKVRDLSRAVTQAVQAEGLPVDTREVWDRLAAEIRPNAASSPPRAGGDRDGEVVDV